MTSSSTVSSVVLSRYAGALIDLAEQVSAVKAVQKDFREIEAMIKGSKELESFISSPLISKQAQEKVISDISNKAKLNKLTKNFLGVLVLNRRLNALEGVIKAYDEAVSLRSGELSVRVETAVKLTAAQEKAFQKKISAVIGSNALVDAVVTPEILGGMIVTIGSYMVDDSVRRKLERLGSALRQGSNQNNSNQDQNLKEVV